MKNYNPHTLAQLQEDLSQLTTDSKIISGGTDLIIRLNQGLVEPDALLYMGNVEGLDSVVEKEDYIQIGAACKMDYLSKNELILKHAKSVADAAGDVGSPQIRNHGTIGGNIANASPAGDTIPVMWLLDAIVVIAGPDGVREAPIHEVILGPGKTSLSHQEAIIAFKVKKRDENTSSAFVKLGFRSKVTISRIGMAVELNMNDGIVKEAKVIAGAISLTPQRVLEAEKVLVGSTLDEETRMKAADAVSQLIMKITPEKFDRDYKVYASKGVVEDVLLKFC